MKHKRGLLAICLIICLFSIATASASDINDTVLTSNNDLIENEATISTEILSANRDGTFTDLANEIDRATDELNLTRNYRYTDDSIYKDGIPIDKSIVINGNGFTINGNNQAKAFNVKSSSVTLNDISVVNASAEEYGVIYWSGADGSVANCSFVNCDGAISWNAADGSVANCSFVNCDGAIFWYATEGSVANCIFMNCHSKYFSAIEWGGENGTITNCNFTNCTAGEDGGVIDINVGTITNCNFANCAAGEDGGVIDFGDGTITNCNFTNCTAGRSSGAIYYAGDATITNCNFINCTAEYSGGALSSSYGTATITNCNFTNCTAEDGGAIYYVGDGTITNCNFINCTAEDGGGAIYYIGDGTITNCNFINCTAEDGGATFQGIVANCTFINNSAKYGGAMYGGTAVNCTFNWNTATYYGGAVYDARVSTSSKFNNNHAPNGKDTYNVTWFDRVDGKTFTDLKNLIEESSSDVYLNDDYTFDLNSDYNLLDGINVDHAMTVHGNGHTINGNNEARIFNVDAKEVIFKDMLFVNAISFNSGGAIYKGISVNCTFINNSAKVHGGAICEGAAVNCTFINNSANVHGGAIYNGSALNCTFTNNHANIYGGATYYSKVTNCIFKGKSTGEGDNDVYPILDTVLTARYDNATKNIVATVKDAKGNPVSGIKVGFACNGVKYVLTDVNGQALFSTSNLAGGSNTVKIMAYGGQTYKNSNQVTVTVNKEQAKIYLRNALYFVLQTKMVQLTLWDANNNPIAGKTVYINLDEYGLKYSGVTDEDGNAYIRVGVGFGNHPATVSFEGDDVYNADSKTGRVRVIKETPSLMLPGAYTKFKATDATKTIKVYLKDRYNKPLLPGTKVFVKINGKQYVGQINEEGIASINIILNKAGVYDVELYYTGNTAYNAVRKTTKITIV